MSYKLLDATRIIPIGLFVVLYLNQVDFFYVYPIVLDLIRVFTTRKLYFEDTKLFAIIDKKRNIAMDAAFSVTVISLLWWLTLKDALFHGAILLLIPIYQLLMTSIFKLTEVRFLITKDGLKQPEFYLKDYSWNDVELFSFEKEVLYVRIRNKNTVNIKLSKRDMEALKKFIVQEGIPIIS